MSENDKIIYYIIIKHTLCTFYIMSLNTNNKTTTNTPTNLIQPRISYAQAAQSKIAGSHACGETPQFRKKSTQITTKIVKTPEPQKEKLFVVLCREYPVAETPLIAHLRSIDSQGNLHTWQDFAMGVSEYSELQEGDSGMNVCKSSTWAVCQEFLGNLSGQDLWYSKQRGGLWSFDQANAKIITVREILNRFKTDFPVLQRCGNSIRR